MLILVLSILAGWSGVLKVKVMVLLTGTPVAVSAGSDLQYEKGHVDQADKSCEKGGYDGYIDGDCGYLN